jgi:hypothetical protein
VKDELWKPQGERVEEDKKDNKTDIKYRENRVQGRKNSERGGLNMQLQITL